MSGTISSAVEDLCQALDRSAGDDEANRRLVIREALRKAQELGWQEGYTDGIVDGGHPRRGNNVLAQHN